MLTPIHLRSKSRRRGFRFDFRQGLLNSSLAALHSATAFWRMGSVHLPFMIAAPTVEGVRHTTSRDDLLAAHKQIVSAARTRRLGRGHCVVWLCRREESWIIKYSLKGVNAAADIRYGANRRFVED